MTSRKVDDAADAGRYWGSLTELTQANDAGAPRRTGPRSLAVGYGGTYLQDGKLFSTYLIASLTSHILYNHLHVLQ